MSGPALEALDGDVGAPVVARRAPRTTAPVTPVTPGCAASSSSIRAKSTCARSLRVAVQLRRDAEGDDVLGLQPEVDARDVGQALDEEAGGDQQRHRQRDLEHGQRGAEHRRAARARRLAGLSLERRQQVGARAVQRREEAEQHAGAEGQRPRRTAARVGSSSMPERRAPRRSGRIDGDQLQRPLRDDAGRRARPAPRAAAIRSAAAGSSAQRLAPIDSRTAISPVRAAARASSRLAMLAQAISSTRPVTPSSIFSGGPASRAHRALALVPRLDARASWSRNCCIRWSLMPRLQRRLDVVDDAAVDAVHPAARLLDA